MTRRRFYPTSTPMVGIGRSTRAQSVARSTFAPTFSAPPPRRRAFDDDIIGHGHIPFKPFISHASYGRYIDTTGSENFTRSEINRELMMTSAAMEDNYDIVNMSRSKDKDVLSRANRAIANTEVHSTPRSAVAARRVMQRGYSTPPEYISKTVTQKTEAALLGRKVDVVTPAGRRRPKSQYAQNKMREMRKEHRESNSYSPEDTHSLRASRPVHQIVTQPKPYVPVAPEKKKNLLSWQYRIDAYSNPDDMLMVPRSVNSVKAQIRDVQDKMDRHKQLMDRYLNKDTGLSVDDMRVFVSSVEPPAWPKEERASERIRRRRLKIWRKYHGDD